MRLRIRGPSGQSVVNLDDTQTVENLRKIIATETALTKFDIKYGYPPQTLALDQYPASTLLRDLDVRLNGEQLIVSKKSTQDVTHHAPVAKSTTSPVASSSAGALRDTKATAYAPASQEKTGTPTVEPGFSLGHPRTAAPPKAATRSTPKAGDVPPSAPVSLKRKNNFDVTNDPPEIALPDRGGVLVHRVMPDDNSCLFRAVASAVLPGLDPMNELRSIIAQAVHENPDEYPKVVLDNKDPDDYCRWIQTEDAWGGQIELVILSKHFDVEICSIDIQSSRVDKYNEGQPNRCILAYSGIHYDTIAFSAFGSPPEEDQRIFPSSEDSILDAAKLLCQKLNAKGYYTDTAGMQIQCKDCGTVSTGEAGAAAHAATTGHYNMEEVQRV